MVTRLTQMAPMSLFPVTTATPKLHRAHTGVSSITCCICMDMPDRPIELGCGNLVCLLCTTKWLTISQSVECPCCQTPLSDYAQLLSRITLDVIGSQLVVCSRGVVRAEHYIAHLNSAFLSILFTLHLEPLSEMC